MNMTIPMRPPSHLAVKCQLELLLTVIISKLWFAVKVATLISRTRLLRNQ